VERLPSGRHGKNSSRGARVRAFSHRAWGRTAVLASAAVLVGVALPSGIGAASTAGSSPSLKTLMAEAAKLSNQIDGLSEQYDGLRIQLNEARSEEKIARQTTLRDQRALSAGKLAVGQIAAEGYLTGGVDPSLELLQSSDPQAFLDRASIMLQLEHENGTQVNLLAAAEEAAQRAERRHHVQLAGPVPDGQLGLQCLHLGTVRAVRKTHRGHGEDGSAVERRHQHPRVKRMDARPGQAVRARLFAEVAHLGSEGVRPEQRVVEVGRERRG